jgi:hypothetical protein
MQLILNKIPAVECPVYVKDFISGWSGIQFQDMTLQEVAVLKPKTFLTNEDFLLDNMDKIFEVMGQNGIKEIVIHALHIYKFNHAIFEKLNRMAEGKKVHFISMSYMVKNYTNIIPHSHDIVEHGISHDANLIFCERLRSRRRPELDFIFMVNTKNPFRQQLSTALEQSGVLKNSIVSNGGQDEYKQLVQKQKDMIDSINKQLSVKDAHRVVDALASWTNIPNFSAYEKCFCEIVVESANGKFDNTRDSVFTDLSEKTYRPIALGVPFVFLGSEDMFNKLTQNGYQLLDDDDFYKKWYNGSNFQTMVSHLISFLEKIMTDMDLRQKLESMAKHNYHHFWVNRKLEHRRNNLQFCKDCFGESPYDRVYDCFDF